MAGYRPGQNCESVTGYAANKWGAHRDMESEKQYYLVKCRTCGAANRVPAKMAGKRGRCGECHGTLPVLYLEPLVLGDTTFRDFLQSYAGPVIAEFWAPW